MSSAVNKIKDALHIGNNDEFEKENNQSGIPHPGNRFDPDSNSGLSSSKYSRAKAATGHDTLTGTGHDDLTGTGTGTGNENLSGTVLDYSTGQNYNPGDIRVDHHLGSQYPSQAHGNLGETLGKTPHASNTEPHKSGILNKLDPRIELNSSERRDNHTRTPGGLSRAFGDNSTTGFGNESQNSGLRSDDIADKMDPRIHTHRHQSHDVDGSGKFF